MKKRAFLTSVAALATTLAVDASAILPQSVQDQVAQSVQSSPVDQQAGAGAYNPFVLEAPTGHVQVAAHRSHSSHASHASHSSHFSSR